MDYVLAIGLGGIAGFVWEYISNKPYKAFSTLIPSYYLKGVHVHHWLWYLLVLTIVLIVALRTGRLFHPSILMIVSAIVAAMVYGFIFLEGWGSFVK